MTEWIYTLKFRSSVSVFSGLAVAGLVDRMVMRNHKKIVTVHSPTQNGEVETEQLQKLPFIPGSSVKGRWRFFAERLLQSNGLPDGLIIHKSNKPSCKDPNNLCTLCKLFGSPAFPSMLFVGQAELDGTLQDHFEKLLEQNPNPVVHPDTELRPGTAISRITRTTLKDHLFFNEAVPPVIFSGKLIINDTLNDNEEKFLKASASLVDRIGGRKSIGMGALDGGIRIASKGGDR
ncbi:MAG: RAMP superfamily CRISPR-associated protein [Deltaproteobacteria bacterium]|nr:RAMP superfamily CRISPR-associated protein [Deltaproteobacteria bacterium]